MTEEKRVDAQKTTIGVGAVGGVSRALAGLWQGDFRQRFAVFS